MYPFILWTIVSYNFRQQALLIQTVKVCMAGVHIVSVRQVAYLDLRRMRMGVRAGLLDAGPAACLAGRIALLPGLFGTSSQACCRSYVHMRACSDMRGLALFWGRSAVSQGHAADGNAMR